MWLFTLITILAQTDAQGSTPVWVPVLLIILMILLFWWGTTRPQVGQTPMTDDGHHSDDHEAAHQDSTAETLPAQAEVHTMEPELAAAPETAVPSTQPDDLKQIEGIGPKIEGILHEAGITTFAGLAATDVERLVQIVREDAGIRVSYPDTWPEQAALAAAGNWEALNSLQEQLKGGRRA